MASKLHVRSNSLPNGSHPCSSRVQEHLNNLRNFEATCTSESVATGLSLLEDLYFSLDNLLNVGSTQKAISDHQSEKCFQEILDGSIEVLDVCSITRDFFMQIKENSKATKWMNKLMHKGEVSSKSANELQLVDAALNTILNEGAKDSQIQASNEQLEALEIAVESIQSGLENLFRRMIKTRTSLLNILSQ
ncbi:hypothetical protein PIB30_015652 [Stylosanthes scabra]|uniref:Uncharacterized protein n=1 Tax=Stylosanthes scabra TaxID=79078 RepID=A0ABU6T7X5_9FABA|nr:hypothetical protein [Stylosanthes scabra]